MNLMNLMFGASRLSDLSDGPAWTVTACRWCGGWHDGPCPHVRAIEYYPDGTLKRVELWGDAWTAGAYTPEPKEPA